MIRVPNGWEVRPIGEVAKIVAGGTPPSKDPTNFQDEGGIPWLTPADLSGYRHKYISRGSRNLSESGYRACSATKMPPGSVLFSSRAPIGYVAIAENEITTNQGFKSFVLPDGIDSGFVYHYLRHIKPLAENLATGTTFKELSGAATGKLPLLIAPLAEQKRIADKLDAVLARVDACRDRLDRIPSILKRFRQSVLAAATSGQLTADWRARRVIMEDDAGSPTANSDCGSSSFDSQFQSKLAPYPMVQLSDVADSRLGKMLDKEKNTGKARAYLRNVNVRWFNFDLSDLQEMRVEDSDLEQVSVAFGDLLICEGGEPGRCAVWTGESGQFVFQKALHRVRPKDKRLNLVWLAYCLKLAADQKQLDELFTGTTIKHLTGVSLAKFRFPLPDSEEQEEIVRRVETLFAFADRLEARVTAARESADRLTPALLAKAFRGELVPQDPNDEPAAELLKRLAANNNGEDKPKRGRKRA
ncbi:MAG: restriction endonuclease subunit S, partial [Permianibacter sp.]